MQSPDTAICPVCKSTQWNVLHPQTLDYLSGERFDIVTCASCGLEKTYPLPLPEQVGRYYPDAYRVKRHRFSEQFRLMQRARCVTRYFPRGFKGSILDLGGGDGSFPRAMLARGWSAAASEIDPGNVAKMRAAGIDAISPAELAERTQPFDAITCWHVQEHLFDPRDEINRVARLLKPGGIFHVSVPNLLSWQSRICGRDWLHLDPPRHLFHFTPATLQRLIDDAGLKVIYRTTLAIEYDWFGWMQSLLNKVCDEPNVLFRLLTGAPDSWKPKTGDKWLSILGGAFSAPLTFAATGASWLARKGGTLTLTCRKE